MAVRTDFSGPGDLVDMQAMCSRLWSPTARFHPGQLAWNRHHQWVEPDRPGPGEQISLWRADGQVVGFGWAEAPDWLELQVDPAHPEVGPAIIDWFEEISDSPDQSVLTMDHDPLSSVLAAAGFEPEVPDWHFVHHHHDLLSLPPIPATPGYVLRPVADGEEEARAACHRAAWEEFGPSPFSRAAYGQLRAAPPYRPELDYVAAHEATGELVASGIVWLDPMTRVGLLEPLGCIPTHRGHGLAGALTVAALHQLRDLGGRSALVDPRGDDDHPGPARLYRSLGFTPGARTRTWTRQLGQ